MRKFSALFFSSALGLYLSSILISGFMIEIFPDSKILGMKVSSRWQVIFIFAFFLALLNYFLKPILKILTLPLHFLTLGISTFIINLSLVFFLFLFIKELQFKGFIPLFLSSLLISFCNFILPYFLKLL